jgi:hypothetical protein
MTEELVQAVERLDSHADHATLLQILGNVEDLDFEDLGHRARLAPALYQAALSLRERPSTHEPLVWSALRRFASLAPEKDIALLVRFMGDENRIHTRICALQCVQHAFYGQDPQTPVDARLAERLEHLCVENLTAEILDNHDVQHSVLALNAAVSFTILKPEEIPSIAQHLRALDVPFAHRFAANKWLEIAKFREGLGRDISPLYEGIRTLGFGVVGNALVKK